MNANRRHDYDDPPEDVGAILGPLLEHDELLRHFATIKLDRVRALQPLAGCQREDAVPRARRRAAELPPVAELERWYRVLRPALEGPVDDRRARELVTLMMEAMRGKPAGALLVESYVFALKDARMSPQIVAGAVKRAWMACRSKPTLQAFLKICATHQAETKEALEQVVRTIGLRRDAEKVVGALEL